MTQAAPHTRPSQLDSGEIRLVRPDEMMELAIMAEETGRLRIELPAPRPAARGRLALVIEEAVETALARRGAPPPGVGASSDLDASLSDQLYRARQVGGNGLALFLGSLEGIANLAGSLDADDSAVLRWWIAAARERPVSLYLDAADRFLNVYDAPTALHLLLEQPSADEAVPSAAPEVAASVAAMDLSSPPPPVAEAATSPAVHLRDEIATQPILPKTPTAEAMAAVFVDDERPVSHEVPDEQLRLPLIAEHARPAKTASALAALRALTTAEPLEHECPEASADEMVSETIEQHTPQPEPAAAAPAAAAPAAAAPAAAAEPRDPTPDSTDSDGLTSLVAAMSDTTPAGAAAATRDTDTAEAERTSGTRAESGGATDHDAAADASADAALISSLLHGAASEGIDAAWEGADSGPASEAPFDPASLVDEITEHGEETAGSSAAASTDDETAAGEALSDVDASVGGDFDAHQSAAPSVEPGSDHAADSDRDEGAHADADSSDDAPSVETASDGAASVEAASAHDAAQADHGPGASSVEAASAHDTAQADHGPGASSVEAASAHDAAQADHGPGDDAPFTTENPLGEPLHPNAAEEWPSWRRELDSARGPKPLAVIERMFVGSYVPLRDALARGIADPDASEVADTWAQSFEKSYSEAFDALRLRGKRPTMVLDVPDIALRIARLHGARSIQLLVVDGMRFDLGLRVQDRLKKGLDQHAALTERLLLWSALPTTTATQLELIGRGPDGLKDMNEDPDSDVPVARGRAATSLRRIKTGHRELMKLDVVEARLGEPGGPLAPRLDALADEVSDAVSNYMLRLQPRSLVMLFGDHGFVLDRLEDGTSAAQQGGASPEEVLVPAFAWLVGSMH